MNTRRTISLLAAAAVALSLSACAGSDNGESDQTTQSNENVQSGAVTGEPSEAGTNLDASEEAPKVVREPDGGIPGISFSDDGIPKMKPLKEDPPKDISVKTLKKGDGAEVLPDDTLTVNYAGFLWEDGSQFDSSFDRGQTATFSLNAVIKGWKWGLAGTHVGDTVEIVIPSDYGYGPNGNPPAIPGDATLVFVVEIQDTYTVDPAILKDAKLTENELPGGIEISGELGEEPEVKFNQSAKEPKEAQTVVLAEGTGPVVTDTDSVIVHLVGGTWGASTVQSTWAERPEQLGGTAPELLGQHVGSRILIVQPRSEEINTASFIVVDIVAAVPQG